MTNKFADWLKRVSAATAAIGGLWGVGIAIVGVLGVTFVTILSLPPNVGTRVNIANIEKIGELVVLKVVDEFVVTKTNETGRIRGTYITPCDALLSLDFSKIRATRTNDTYYVSLPEIKVKEARIDRNGLRSFDIDKSIMGTFDHADALRNDAMKEAEQKITQIASASKYRDAAQAQATNIVASLFLVGAENKNQKLRFVWIWPNSQTNDVPSSKTGEVP